jgi:ankyrin repeat protein
MRKTFVIALGLLCTLAPARFAGAADDTVVADAVMHRDVSALRTLIAKRADVNAPLADGSTALHWAVYWNDLEAVDLLLGAGANPKAATRLNATPLFLATRSGTPAVVARLLSAGVDDNAPFLSNGETALMVAARSGNREIVARLLEAGANVDAKETLRGTTALSWAAEENHADIVSLLISRGASPQAASKVVVGAARRGDDDADDPGPAPTGNANARGGVTPLMVATRERAVETIKVLLDGGAPINQQAGDGTTALIVALQNGDAAIARMLLERGAAADMGNAKGWTPLFLAVKARSREIGTVPNPVIDQAALFDVIKLLVEKGANVNARTSVRSETYGATAWLRDAGATPLLRAAYCADLPVMKYLLDHGADPLIATTDGTTTLMALTGVGYGDGFTKDIGTPDETYEALQLLVGLGVPVNAANNDKVTALHGAAHKNFARGIEYLVEKGADMTAVSQFTAGTFIRAGSRGQTVLDWATGVMVNMQSSSYKTEAVAMVTKLMKERNIAIEPLTNTRGGGTASVGGVQ